jgi:ABC-type proline/glycine betaine transport system permease subunit
MFSVFLYLVNYDSHFQLFNESLGCHDVKPFFNIILQPYILTTMAICLGHLLMLSLHMVILGSDYGL